MVSISKDTLRYCGLIDDDELADAHLRVEETDDTMKIEPAR